MAQRNLKQHVVVVNEFTVPDRNGKGSRGSTPGDYILRYMARDLATETIAPIRRTDAEDYAIRYMARERATEVAVSRDELRTSMVKAQGLGGRAFSSDSVALSDAALRAKAKDVQHWFDEGHTTLKTVISFDQDYLVEHGVVPEDLKIDKEGDYRGHVDQLKLRMAIMRGMERMSHRFDDLRWVGVIQVDTRHVHCHLEMVDAGVGRDVNGRPATDGRAQTGMLFDSDKAFLRRGIDAYLDEKQVVAHMSAATQYDRRNVTSFVKRWAHERIRDDALPQFLIACLPQDRSLWRAGSNAQEMRKANAIMRELVGEVLDKPESGFVDAMAGIQSYADGRREREGLSHDAWASIVETGRARIIDKSINGVYSMLRAIPQEELVVRTPMLETMSMDYEELAASAQRQGDGSSLEDFSYRLRSYSRRLDDHRDKRRENHERARSWEADARSGAASADSQVMHTYYLLEEEYHAKVMAKYRHFLTFVPDEDEWYEGWDEIVEQGERTSSVEMMSKDPSLAQLKDRDEAERLGLAIYGQAGGRFVGGSSAEERESNASIMSRRLDRMRERHRDLIEDFRGRLAEKGLVLDVDDEEGRGTARVEPGTEYPFEEVKGLDMHRMGWDFTRDVPVGPNTAARFTAMTRRRREALDDAVDYLRSTGQEDAVATLDVRDVERMEELCAHLSEELTLPSRVAELSRAEAGRRRQRRSSTVVLAEYGAPEISQRTLIAVRGSVIEVGDELTRSSQTLE